MKKAIKKLLDFWSTIVASFLLLVLGGSMASGALALPTWLSWIPAGLGIVIGWFLVGVSILNFITSLINLFMK